ncbi:TetR family transcriptional regulator [Kribbella sp. DT2]|uniref:acyl-CoA-like ligand-binding transcription factor n=1 Tax=Kribbella sp. DT2 TaxID=3393427 RepID=UPI003CF66F9E
MATTGDLGHRERKKLATRAALSAAALQQAVEGGFEQLRVEEIAAAADVSPRTFNNYFASKEAAIVDLFAARVERLRSELAARPADEPLWDAIAAAATALVPAPAELPRWLESARLIARTPSLEAEYLRAYATLERILTAEIAARTGTDPDRDLFPRLAANVAAGAIRAAFQYWVDTPATGPYGELLQRAVVEAGTGLHLPTTSEQG